jgi:hypothetical protein
MASFEQIGTFRRYPYARRLATIALAAGLLAGCNEATPSHTVVVKPGQTLDDIGEAECGPSAFNITIWPRRNQIRDFNDMSGYDVKTGQKLKIPDSLCYDTGDKQPLQS